MNAVLLENQIKHIEQHKQLFFDNCGDDVRQYFADYNDEYFDLYERLCADLGLTPRHVCNCSGCQCK